MKKIAILLCVSLLVFTGCSGKKMRSEKNNSFSESSENKYRLEEIYWNGSLTLLKSNNLPLTGYVQWFVKKQLKREEYFINGIQNGTSRVFREDGSIESEQDFLNGELRFSIEYFKNGLTSTKSYYTDGEKTSFKSWFKDGRKSMEENYKNGEINGQSIKWYSSGGLRSVSNYEKGKRIGWQTEYSRNGDLLYKINLINGNGVISYKIPNTELVFTEEYLDGKKVIPQSGKHITHWDHSIVTEIVYENGQRKTQTRRNVLKNKIYSEYNYENELLHGQCRSWHDNGLKRIEESCNNGQVHGLYRRWHENGKLAEQGHYSYSIKRGKWQEWYENGKLKLLETYTNGKLVSRKWWDESGKAIK